MTGVAKNNILRSAMRTKR